MKVFENQPLGFIPKIKVCGFFLKHKEKFLLLKRHPDKSHGNHWNLPAGKLEKNETTYEAAMREVLEESGIALVKQKGYFLGTLYFVCKDISFEFHLYYTELLDEPILSLAEGETIDGKWWTWGDQIDPLIPGGVEVLNFCKMKIDSKTYLEIDQNVDETAC